MKIKALLMTAVATAMLTATGAVARDRDHDGRPDNRTEIRHDQIRHDRSVHSDYRTNMRRDEIRHDRDVHDDWRGRQAWHWQDNRGWHGDHDRYWRSGFRYGYWAPRDRFYVGLRSHGYYRWSGDPYWYHGRYVIRTYDRWGNVIFVEMNPYTGGFVGVIRF